jgi:ubiquinone/menaquinone biosynthesis C-methylase UbiE
MRLLPDNYEGALLRRPLFSSMSPARKNNHYYDRSNLTEAILGALTASGKDPANITIDDLAPVDELHVRGRKATKELAAGLALHPGSQVLDLGCGIGGAARYLAAEFGCKVTGIDLTYEYCRAAAVLGRITGLSNRTAFLQGDATCLPFGDATFDCVWTVHTAMNIPDKKKLYGEIHRVLKPGGALAIYDILAGTGGEIHTPVPWAREPGQSHLATPEELHQLIAGAGFSISSWKDTTEAGKIWFSRLAQRTEGGTPHPLGMKLIFGSDFSQMAKNQVRNLVENRIVLIECTARRPG